MQRKLYTESVEPTSPRATPSSSATASIRFGYITPPEGVDVFMVAPKGPGPRARSTSTRAAYPCSSPSRRTRPEPGTPLSYAKAIGGLRAGGIKTTFTEETETDLFGEQAVLCGGASQLVQYGFEVLTEAVPGRGGVLRVPARAQADRRPHVRGQHRQQWSSPTPQYGDYVSGPRVITPEVKENMKAVARHHERQVRAALHRRPGRRRAGVQGPAQRARSTRSRAPAASSASSMSWVKSHDADYVEGTATC